MKTAYQTTNPAAAAFLSLFRTKATAQRYKSMLWLLFTFIADMGGPAEAAVDFGRLIPRTATNGDVLFHTPMDRQFVRQFAKTWLTEDLTPRTLRDRVEALRIFCEFLCEQEILPENPARCLPVPRIPPKERDDWLRLEEMEALLRAAEASAFPERDTALLLTMALLGLRPAETAGLLAGDIDFPLRQVRVHHKTKVHAAPVPLPDNLAAIYAEYMNHPIRKAQQSLFLFLDDAARPFTSDTLRSHLKAISASAGLDRNTTPYQLRHTAATLYYLAGASLTDVQHLLRHDVINTTKRYTHGIDLTLPQVLRNRKAEQVLAHWLRQLLVKPASQPAAVPVAPSPSPRRRLHLVPPPSST